MKAQFFKPLLFATILFAACSLNAQTLREESQKEFNTNATTTLSVDNQFGNVTITDWDQNKVSIAYVVEVTASPEAKAKKLMELIKVEIREEGGQITAKTTIGKNNSIDLKADTGEKFKIDYTIKCPKNLPLKVVNNFGNISISNMTSKTEIDLGFGNLNAVSLTGNGSTIGLQFSKATIGELGEASLSLEHSDVVKITSAKSLTLEASFANLSLGIVDNLKVEASSGSTTVEKLTGSLVYEGSMGSLEIKDLAAGFSKVKIEQEMGNISLAVDPKAGYKLHAEAEMGNISVPSGFKADKSEKNELPGVTSSKVTGTMGNGASEITIEASMGSVKIK